MQADVWGSLQVRQPGRAGPRGDHRRAHAAAGEYLSKNDGSPILASVKVPQWLEKKSISIILPSVI